MQPALFCPLKYSAEFATVHFVDPDFGWQVTIWQFGKPTGHAWYATIYEAVLAIVSNGWQWASEGMKRIFEADIILSTGE